MKKGIKSPLSGMGGITVFMVLAVLTVAVFSVLTLTTAMADTNLSQRNADLVSAYYEADALGVDLLAALSEAWPQGRDMPDEAVFLAVADSVVPGIALTLWPMEEQVLFFGTFPVGERRSLEFEAVFNQGDRPQWKIVKWVFLPDSIDETEDTLPVWQLG